MTDERSQFELVPCGVCRCCVLWKAAPVAAITAEQKAEILRLARRHLQRDLRDYLDKIGGQ
jgi:hypothetical protein